jgi:anti-sigma factor RsiW
MDSDGGRLNGRHPAPDVIDAFLAGEVDEVTAVRVAQHLDSCPACRQMAFMEDALHSALVGADERAEAPDGLASEILRAHTQEVEHSGRTPVIAMALIAAAGLVFASGGNPSGLFSEGAAWSRGLSMAASAVSGVSGIGGWVAAPGVALFAGLALVMISQRKG